MEVANAELRAQNVKLSREWEPFQQTVKYFAGEANLRRPLPVRRGPLGRVAKCGVGGGVVSGGG